MQVVKRYLDRIIHLQKHVFKTTLSYWKILADNKIPFLDYKTFYVYNILFSFCLCFIEGQEEYLFMLLQSLEEGSNHVFAYIGIHFVRMG